MIEFDGTRFELQASTLPTAIKEKVIAFLKDAGAENDEKISDYVGGSLFLVETEADLAKVQGLRSDTITELYASLADGPLVLDLCEQVGDNYIECWLATNNAGGSSYFIPSHLWTYNVLETLRINKVNA